MFSLEIEYGCYVGGNVNNINYSVDHRKIKTVVVCLTTVCT
jgi:hypothetical protein